MFQGPRLVDSITSPSVIFIRKACYHFLHLHLDNDSYLDVVILCISPNSLLVEGETHKKQGTNSKGNHVQLI